MCRTSESTSSNRMNRAWRSTTVSSLKSMLIMGAWSDFQSSYNGKCTGSDRYDGIPQGTTLNHGLGQKVLGFLL